MPLMADQKSAGIDVVTKDNSLSGTIIGAYYLLPKDLQFDSLDYLNDSSATINARWENHSFVDMLPSMGIVAAGFVVDGIIRYLSATHAGKLAQENIADGKIEFEPKLLLPALVLSDNNGFGQSGYGLGIKKYF